MVDDPRSQYCHCVVVKHIAASYTEPKRPLCTNAGNDENLNLVLIVKLVACENAGVVELPVFASLPPALLLRQPLK